jgi:hypothetical protein
MLGGKSLLFNINAQYGVFVFYFLKLVFSILPIGFTSFALVITILQTIQYFIFYCIARKILPGEILAFFAVTALLLVNHFAMIDYFSCYPSTGVMRFGFVYLLTALILLRNHFQKGKWLFLWLESILVGIASFWSLEVCFYTVPSYLAFMLYDSIQVGARIQFDWKSYLKRVFLLAVSVGLVCGYLYADIYSKTLEYPHWQYYLDYFFLYRDGFGMLVTPISGYWWLMMGVYYFSFLSILAVSLQGHRDGKTLPLELNSIFFLTIYGIFQFYYYLGRSNFNALFHVSMPCILVGVYWLSYLRHCNPPGVPSVFKKVGFTVAVVIMGIYIQMFVPNAVRKIGLAHASLPVMWQRTVLAFQDMPKCDVDYVQAADRLMKKYSGDRKGLVYFFGDMGFEVSLYTGRVNVYPYNDFNQASILGPVVNRIAAFDPQLKTGDYIYYDTDAAKDDKKFEYYLLLSLQKKYNLKIVEKDQKIIAAEVVNQPVLKRRGIKSVPGH